MTTDVICPLCEHGMSGHGPRGCEAVDNGVAQRSIDTGSAPWCGCGVTDEERDET